MAALVSTSVFALGLGAAHGVQHVGRPLYAEIQLQSAETAGIECFGAQPVPGDDGYFVRDLQLELEGRPLARRLVVRSTTAIREPLVSFRIEARCDGVIARDYVLIANAPQGAAAPAANARVTPPQTRAPNLQSAPKKSPEVSGTYVVRHATTLNAMARALFPEDRAARDRYRAAIAAANPELFTGIEHTGALPLTAGTTLVMPAEIARVPAINPPRQTRAKSAPAADRLSIGLNEGPIKRLTDAILRLEQVQSDRQQRESELVTALSNAVSGIVELRDKVSAQSVQLAALAQQQRMAESEAQRARESAPDLMTLLALILAAGAVGAGLMALHHWLAGHRRAALTPMEHHAVDTVEPMLMRAAEPAVTVTPPAETRANPAAANKSAIPTGPTAAESTVEHAHDELGLDALMTNFHHQASDVVSAIEHLRMSKSRDPADWLRLMRSARTAGLLNDESVTAMNAQFSEMFNISLGDSSSNSVEDFPRVIAGICADWGRSDCLTRIVQLIYDDRDGLRRGFPEAVADELILLRDVLLVRISMYGEETTPPWTPPQGPAVPKSETEIPATRAESRAAAREFSIDFAPPD